MPSPYRLVSDWIGQHPDTDGADALAKLTLSLWKPEMAFSLKECLAALDPESTAIALALVRHSAVEDVGYELNQLGENLREAFPRLWALGCAGDAAKVKQTADWYTEDLIRG